MVAGKGSLPGTLGWKERRGREVTARCGDVLCCPEPSDRDPGVILTITSNLEYKPTTSPGTRERESTGVTGGAEQGSCGQWGQTGSRGVVGTLGGKGGSKEPWFRERFRERAVDQG